MPAFPSEFDATPCCLAEHEARPGALLTPQGKILLDFMVWRDGVITDLETDSDQRDGLLI